ncbi:MAG: hypothetical protein CVV21_05080 [Candidatus Goldiibacteriota bacterium HGW-Goldbacteria-1]|jgi:flavin-dependent dehydrogenase|nr:MAG: hypothetical protein CVV21_05080 [Candidatus Goldiibacteriota bacterium HGW-Goldbacteria-1]
MVGVIKQYDVIVAGGGPAGLTAAREISKTGLKTLLIEKGIIGSAPRSWITWYDGLKKEGYADTAVNRIDTLTFSSFLGGKYDLKKSDSVIVNTKKMLLKMKKEALNSGVEVKEKEVYLSCRQKSGSVGIKTSKASYSGRYCVDATGWNSKKQRKLSGNMARNDHMGCYAVEMKLKESIKDTSKALIFDAAFPGKDYFWFLPYNKHDVLIGCFSFEKLDNKSGKRMKDSLNKYIKFLGVSGKRTNIISGNIPLMERKHFSSERIFFCGDSVSSPLPSSGFGLLRAMQEAKLLAKCINEGFETGKIEYEKHVIAVRYPGYELHYLAADILKNMNDAIFNKTVSQMKINSPMFIRSFLIGNDLSLKFAARALNAIFKTFTLQEIASMAIKRDYKEFLLRAARDYPKIEPKKIISTFSKLFMELNRTGLKE